MRKTHFFLTIHSLVLLASACTLARIETISETPEVESSTTTAIPTAWKESVSTPGSGLTPSPSLAPTIQLTAVPLPTQNTATNAPTTSDDPITADARVRQGIARCTDRQALIQAAYPWLEDSEILTMDSLLPAEHPAYAGSSPQYPHYPYDSTVGKALFEAAGWKLSPGKRFRENERGEELHLRLVSSDSSLRKAWVKVFIGQMSACGLNVEASFIPAEQFFSTEGPLFQRQFDLAAYARVYTSMLAPDQLSAYECEGIPSIENRWQGQNFSGWCKLAASRSAESAAGSPRAEDRDEALRQLQLFYAQDLPGLPLFRRVDASAARAELENFEPVASQPFTWNASDWVLPDIDRIVIGERSEPAGLYPWDESYVNQVILALVNGVDSIYRDGSYQPVMLLQIPSLENGGVRINPVRLGSGNPVIDKDGNLVELAGGVRYTDEQGNPAVYESGTITMSQAIVRYEYPENLSWSDGEPVRAEDYELGYRIQCDPETFGEELYPPEWISRVCAGIEDVKFLDDDAFEVTWKPGYVDGCNGMCPYFLPPFPRLPAHIVLQDGRRLGDVAKEWKTLEDVYRGLPGAGPYTISRWTFGKEMLLKASPHYFKGKPATREILIRFIPQDRTVGALLAGDVDLLGWDSISPENVPELIDAAETDDVEVYPTTAVVYELIDFSLVPP